MSSANLRSVAVGSAPGVRMKIRGMQQCESANEAGKSKGGDSTNLWPKCSEILK